MSIFHILFEMYICNPGGQEKMNESATTLHEMSLISQIIDYYKSELKKIEDTCDIHKKEYRKMNFLYVV
jgi:hypothetical protein